MNLLEEHIDEKETPNYSLNGIKIDAEDMIEALQEKVKSDLLENFSHTLFVLKR